jgi:hypothetical protein
MTYQDGAYPRVPDRPLLCKGTLFTKGTFGRILPQVHHMVPPKSDGMWVLRNITTQDNSLFSACLPLGVQPLELDLTLVPQSQVVILDKLFMED